MSQKNKDTIKLIREEAVSQGRLDLLDDGLYTNDYVYHGPALIGDLQGVEAFRAMINGFLAGISESREVVEDQVSEGDKVVSRILGSGRHTGELMGAPPTGKQLTWTVICISRFEDGKIAEEWVEFDALDLLQQVGVLPPLG